MASSLGEVTPGASGRERFWNLPNTITVVRAAVVPLLVAFPLLPALQTPAGSRVVAWTFILAAVGDIVDGWAARRGQQVTKIGKLLDPMVDKLTVTAALIALLYIGRIPEWGLPLVVVIIGRELAVTGLRGIASAGGQIVAASGAGKVKTLAQNVAIGCLLFPEGTLGTPNYLWGLSLLILATALTLWSGYVYFASYFRGEASAADATDPGEPTE